VHLDGTKHLTHIVCMKRTNVVLDEELLESVRRASGERTYTAAISRALEEYVRRHDFKEVLTRYQTEVQKGDFFWPGYLEEIRPNAYEVSPKEKISAHEKRAPRTKGRKRAAAR
jgi:Arc/MetJ family transcription regulator